jgi:UDP-2-acetamido-3-amino-2,3-dideoxy-glucuronate N-acetyltransferase
VIHPLAWVSESEVHESANVWQFASVIRGARVGAESNIAACAIVDSACLGSHCLIGHAASVHPGTLLGDDVFIGPSAVICNDSFPRAHKQGWDKRSLNGEHWTVVIDDGASIGANAVILPGVHIGADAFVPAAAVCAKDVPVGHIWLSNGMVFPLGDEAERLKRRMRFATDLVKTPTWAESIRESAREQYR